MKKVFGVIVCLLMAMSVMGQTNDTHEVYCLIVAKGKIFSNKVTITIDYGQSTKLMDGTSKMKLVDEDNKPIKFNSVVDALNYLGNLGWSLFNCYPMSSKQGTCYHYLFKKTIRDGDVVSFKTKEYIDKTEKDDLYN